MKRLENLGKFRCRSYYLKQKFDLHKIPLLVRRWKESSFPPSFGFVRRTPRFQKKNKKERVVRFEKKVVGSRVAAVFFHCFFVGCDGMKMLYRWCIKHEKRRTWFGRWHHILVWRNSNENQSWNVVMDGKWLKQQLPVESENLKLKCIGSILMP